MIVIRPERACSLRERRGLFRNREHIVREIILIREKIGISLIWVNAVDAYASVGGFLQSAKQSKERGLAHSVSPSSP